MKSIRILLLIISSSVFFLNSCSKSDTPTVDEAETGPGTTSNGIYSDIEIEVMKLTNEHRASLGLSALTKNDFISGQCKDHTLYMIKNMVLNHDNFDTRIDNIKKELGAGVATENVAAGQQTAKEVMTSWLNSPGHKKNIEGKSKLFGISIKPDSKGSLYYTVLFY
jgi:uncharacterized protein YkwD